MPGTKRRRTAQPASHVAEATKHGTEAQGVAREVGAEVLEHKREEGEEESKPRGSDPRDAVSINRAPVLTLWAAMVAENKGASSGLAASLGRVIATWFAHKKGAAIGALEQDQFSKVRDTKDSGNDSDSAAEDAKKLEFFNVMGRSVPLKNTPHGLCALKVAKHDAKPVSHKAALGYLKRCFGQSLARTRDAMQHLINKYDGDRKTLDKEAYKLYTQFRPMVASGKGGWGQATTLHLELVRKLGPVSKKEKARRRANFFKKRRTKSG